MSFIKQAFIDRISYITLARSEKRNALNPEMISGLTSAFEEAIQDQDVKVIILQAEGEVFSAGADLAYMQELQTNSDEENREDTESLKRLFLTIDNSPKLVIAKVQGHAIAGGCGLVSVCDIVFSSPRAQFGYTEVKIGFIPALVACFLLRKMGELRVNELLLTGNMIDASQAHHYGLINFIVADPEMDKAVYDYAQNFARSASSNSVTETKSLIRKVRDLSIHDALEAAVQANVMVRSSDDCKRGIKSFLDREKIEW